MPPPPAEDFNFHVSRSLPSPTPSGERLTSLSAPTSPGRASEFYREFDEFSTGIDQTDDDFAFHVSKEAAKCTVSAAELFDGGRIRALRRPADDSYGGRHGGGGGNGEEIETTTSTRNTLLSFASPKSPNSKEDLSRSKGKKTFWCGFTPTWNRQTNNPSAPLLHDDDHDDDDNHTRRGRGRYSTTSGSRHVRGTRSLSPIRHPPLEDEDDQKCKKVVQMQASESSTAFGTVGETPSKSNRMGRLKNFLLFRSASEGRASGKDPLKKVAAFYKKKKEAKQNRKSTSKMGGPASAHERHYAMSKAASDDLKKKTFLPYKQGILLAR